MPHPLIISYYTPNTIYQTHAAQLKESVDRLGLRSRIEPRPSRQSWVENCAQKAEFVRDMHNQEKEALLWVDADAVLRRPVHELVDCKADLAVVRRQGWNFYTGQIFFGTGASRLIEIWSILCRKHPNIWDQVSLGYAWWQASLEGKVSAVWLKEQISRKQKSTALGKAHQKLFSNAAIIHKQESRQARPSQPHEQEYSTKQIPKWWREASARDAPFPLTPEQLHALGLLTMAD